MIPALTKTEKTKLAAIILGEISPSAVLFIILSRPQSTKELIALLGPFIPGDTLRAKIAYAITVTRPAFDSDARFREVAEGVLDKLRGVTDDEGETVAVDPAVADEGETVAVDPAVADAVAFDKLIWNRGGENFSKAVRDPACAITGVKIRGGGTPVLSYGGEGFQKWPVKDENVTHIWAIFFDSDGDGVFERGGKFDWGRSTAADRPLAHLTHYKGWDGYPKKGTPWAAVITDIKGKKRSNVATGVWP